MSEWISVKDKDKLPENDKPILVWLPKEKGSLKYGIAEGFNDGFYDEYEITHWMPLPLPPGEHEYMKQLQEGNK